MSGHSNYQELPDTSEPEVYSFPLSFAQERMWFLDQLQPGSSVYNMPATLRITVPLNVAALEQTVNEIVRRHEMLRTNFALIDGEPRQLVWPELKISIPVIDLRKFPGGTREQERVRLTREEAQRSFDLSSEPLLRMTLLKLGYNDYDLLLTLHHIVCDGWSLEIFLREIVELYPVYASGRKPALPELPIQYADFAQWQRKYLQGTVLAQQLEYWREQLSGEPLGLELPTDFIRPALQSFQGGLHYFNLPAGLVHGLRKVSQDESATLFMTVLAGFKALLYRYTGQPDIVVGTPIANRTRSELEGLIGFFSNTLVLRTQLDGDWSFRELVRHVREETLGAYAHQDLPFEKLVEELQPERNLNRNPLFQVFFVYHAATIREATAPILQKHRDTSGSEQVLPSSITETAKFDLTLYVIEAEDGGLRCACEYSRDLFREDTMERMAGHLRVLLAAAGAEPERSLSELPLLTEEEQQQLVIEWNATSVAYPTEKSLHELFEEQARQRPDALAVKGVDQEINYRDLNGRANQLARYLRRHGVRTETRVGICVERGIEMVVAVLATLKAGGGYVPLDPAYPRERLDVMQRDAQLALVLSHEPVVNRLPAGSAPVVLLDSQWSEIARENKDDPGWSTDENGLAYCIYTSGSTGTPKGVAMPRSTLSNLVHWQSSYTPVAAGDRMLQFTSFSFDVSFLEIVLTLTSGGTLVVIPEQSRRDPLAIMRLLVDQQIHTAFLPAAALQQLAEVVQRETEFNCCLKRIISVGDRLYVTPAVANLVKRIEGCELINEYGPTETHFVTVYSLPGAPDDWPAFPSIGKPIANTEIYILDSQLQPVPVGIPGDLYAGGVALARGYLGRPDLTAERFIPNSFSAEPGGRLYRTGDLARYHPDGNIEFLGRLDHQVKIRGFRVETGEIEVALEQHAGVRQAVVVAQPDGTGQQRLLAYVLEKRPGELAPSELRDWLQAKLPDYMIPSIFLQEGSFPVSPNGKVDRRALSLQTTERPQMAAAYVAPRNEGELLLAKLWSEMLGVKQVGIYDNFFELGGHSLLVTQVISRVRAHFQVEVSLTRFFMSATIADLMLAIVQAGMDQIDATEGEQLLSRLEQISMDEVQRLLSVHGAVAGGSI